MSFVAAAEYAKTMDKRLLPYENERGMEHTRQVVRDLKKEGTLAVFIGPEGGFAPEEVAAAEAAGAVRITLGPRILRTETAPMAALSVIMFAKRNM
jgi:16S rRNA (uracil1498-N3)-methyltransferase